MKYKATLLLMNVRMARRTDPFLQTCMLLCASQAIFRHHTWILRCCKNFHTSKIGLQLTVLEFIFALLLVKFCLSKLTAGL